MARVMIYELVMRYALSVKNRPAIVFLMALLMRILVNDDRSTFTEVLKILS